MSKDEQPLVHTEVADRVAIVMLTNERRRNSISIAMVEQFVASLDQLESDKEVSALVVSGAGEAFCAGADLRQLAKASGGDERAYAAVRGVYRIFERLRQTPIPTVAAVNGAAVGAGMNLALACDIRVAAESAYFSTRFLDLGLHPGGGHTWMLERAVGPAAAKAMVLFHEDVTGREAERIGLAWRCVPDEQLMSEAVSLARKAGRGPREVVQSAKSTIEAVTQIPHYEAAVEYEIERQLWSAQQDAFKQRIAELTKLTLGSGDPPPAGEGSFAFPLRAGPAGEHQREDEAGRREDQAQQQAQALAVALPLGQPRAAGGGDQPDEQQVERDHADGSVVLVHVPRYASCTLGSTCSDDVWSASTTRPVSST